jgi:hypothetical protein
VKRTDTRLSTALGAHPSAVLLGAQLFVVLAYPFLDSVAGRVVLGVLQPGIVLLAVYAVRSTTALTWVALLFGLPAIVFSVLEVVRPGDGWVIVGSALAHVPFYFFVSYAMIRYLFADDRVTRDELYATGAAFTVVAWGFAYLYAAAQVIWPGSFIGAGGPGDRSWFDLLFLSFTTLTSVGLSDIMPVLPHARSLVIVEQVAGVLYIALVVARLVGLTVVGRRHS